MKCKEFKYFLLGCENPDQPPVDVKAHLASCSDCQDWQNRLALIEMNVPFLPVPETAARSELLRKILSQPAISTTSKTGAIGEKELKIEDRESRMEKIPSPILGPREPHPSTQSRIGVISFFRKMEPSARRFALGAVAAAILLVVFGWSVIRTPNGPTGSRDRVSPRTFDPLVASILHRDIRLAESDSAVDRFRALADLADDFSGEIKALAPLPEAKDVLDDLVKKYESVVKVGLVEMAGDLPGGERVHLLNEVADRLHKAGREVDELGDKLSANIPKASRESLRHMTEVAIEADNKLRDLRDVALGPATVGQPSDRMILAQKVRP
jgi:hypothetical protein